MNSRITELNDLDPLQAFAAFYDQPYTLFLDSADRAHPDARYSFLVTAPLETIESKDGRVIITNSEGQTETQGGCAFSILQDRLKNLGFSGPARPGLPPFQGGAAGLFGYDLGRSLEKLPDLAKANPDMPDMAVGIYDQVLAFDHHQNRGWLITQSLRGQDPELARRKESVMLKALENAQDFPAMDEMELDWQAQKKPDRFKADIGKVIEYIYAGDIFQANLSQRFEAKLSENFDIFSHYLNLRAVNPAPFAGFMNLGGMKVSSASPERFLSVRGNVVETRPIKGTRPRVADPVQDELYKRALEASEKDRAENTMIVDLLRNDLSKVCEPESIEVSALCKLESFASVHHLVSTVTGILRTDSTALDLLKACFPGGSITGAPKIRAMEIIEELEPQRRGPYTGSLAYIGFDGAMDSNILIRTLVFDKGRVSFQTGGGITSESQIDAEYQETLDKADGLFRSFVSFRAREKSTTS